MKISIKKIVLSAMFLAIGLVLPIFTGQIPQIGKMLLPMHIPVILCGLICGWQYGLLIGFVTPLLRSVTFGMPILFPTAVAMAFELATYGGVVGILYEKARWKCTKTLFSSMIAAMVSGRVVWGVVMTLIMSSMGSMFTLQLFIAGAFLNAIPGIVLQLVFIPSMMVLLNKTKLVPFSNNKNYNKNTYKEV